MANRDTVKDWSKRGLKPLESQFHQLFDWIRFKDEGIAITDVTSLQTTLNNKADSSTVNTIQAVLFPEARTRTANFTYVMSAGREMEKVRFKPSADITLRIGLTLAGEEILEDLLFEANKWHTVPINEFSDSGRTLYFAGVSVSTDFLFYKR